MRNDEKLGTAPLGRLMLSLALPTVLAQLINVLYNVVDRIYIGHMQGDGNLALTGVGGYASDHHFDCRVQCICRSRRGTACSD